MKISISMITLCLVSFFAVNAHAESAIVFQGDLCIVEFRGPLADPIPLTGNKLHAIAANSDTALLPGKFTCQGYHSSPLTHALIQRAPCYIPGTPFGDLLTEDGMVVFTPGGNWTAQCMFKKPKAD